MISLLPWQHKAFFSTAKRKMVIQKGRRVGFTYGLSLLITHLCLTNSNINKILWGDTVASNNIRYINRYFAPMLDKLNVPWKFSKIYQELLINGVVIDFRSADRPENWEGFGYDLIVLNEAGIILRNKYLYENAVAPMLLDNPNSLLVVGGTPKGKRWHGDIHKFYELSEMAKSDNDWAHFHFTTYDNPLLFRKDIDKLVQGLPSSVARQEIYGEFVDLTEATMFDCDSVLLAQEIEFTESAEPIICGLDVGWANDMTALAFRRGYGIYKVVEIEPVKDDLAMVQKIVPYLKHYKPRVIFCDYGWGTGIVSLLNNMGFNVVGVFFGSKASDAEKYANKKAEMYDKFRKWIESGGSLPKQPKLAKELCSILVEPDSRGRIKVVSKKETEGDSPNMCDACALTFASEVGEAFSQDYDLIDLPSVKVW